MQCHNREYLQHIPYRTAHTFFGMPPANERQRYIVTSSLIGWVHPQNNPCTLLYWLSYIASNISISEKIDMHYSDIPHTLKHVKLSATCMFVQQLGKARKKTSQSVLQPCARRETSLMCWRVSFSVQTLGCFDNPYNQEFLCYEYHVTKTWWLNIPKSIH